MPVILPFRKLVFKDGKFDDKRKLFNRTPTAALISPTGAQTW